MDMNEKINNRIIKLKEFIEKLKLLEKEKESSGVRLIYSGDPWLAQVGNSMLPKNYEDISYRKAKLCREYDIPFNASCVYKEDTKSILRIVILELSNLLNEHSQNCNGCYYLDLVGRSFKKNDRNIHRCISYGVYNHTLNGCISKYVEEEK